MKHGLYLSSGTLQLAMYGCIKWDEISMRSLYSRFGICIDNGVAGFQCLSTEDSFICFSCKDQPWLLCYMKLLGTVQAPNSWRHLRWSYCVWSLAAFALQWVFFCLLFVKWMNMESCCGLKLRLWSPKRFWLHRSGGNVKTPKAYAKKVLVVY